MAYTGIHDSNASLVPHLIAQTAPFTVLSTGTWFIAMAIGGDETVLDESKNTLINVNAFGDPVPSALFMGGRDRANSLSIRRRGLVKKGADKWPTSFFMA